jgi:hypothetical protein
MAVLVNKDRKSNSENKEGLDKISKSIYQGLLF